MLDTCDLMFIKPSIPPVPVKNLRKSSSVVDMLPREGQNKLTNLKMKISKSRRQQRRFFENKFMCLK